MCHFQALCVPCPRFSGFPTLAFLLIFFAFVSVDRILYPVSSVQCHALTTNRHHPYPVQQQYTRKPSVHHQHCNFTTHLHIHYIQNPKMRTTCERRTLISSPLVIVKNVGLDCGHGGAYYVRRRRVSKLLLCVYSYHQPACRVQGTLRYNKMSGRKAG